MWQKIFLVGKRGRMLFQNYTKRFMLHRQQNDATSCGVFVCKVSYLKQCSFVILVCQVFSTGRDINFPVRCTIYFVILSRMCQVNGSIRKEIANDIAKWYD